MFLLLINGSQVPKVLTGQAFLVQQVKIYLVHKLDHRLLKHFFRRVIGGDACIIEGAADQIIVVKVIGITGNGYKCFLNANNGSIAAVAANGTAPYTYLWSNGATTATISNLAPGNYTLTVSDGANCSNTATFTITQPNAFSVVCNPAGTYCVNNGGSISASVSGGTAPFTFAWSNGATTSSISGF